MPALVQETPAPSVVTPAAPPRANPVPAPWSPARRFGFRFAAITLLLVIVPLTEAWWSRLFRVKSFWDVIGQLTSYRTDFFTLNSESFRFGWAGFIPWGIAAFGGLAGATVWSAFAKRQEYRALDYWLRLLVRYRIALGLLAFGFMKLFPTQMPYPSHANLHTDFGDYTAFKLYWQIVGIVPWYEVVIGAVEVGAAILFFFRGTVALGSAIVIGVLGNIVHANLAYDGSVHVYSALFVVLSLYLVAPHWGRVWRLLVRREDVEPDDYRPAYRTAWGRRAHGGVKAALILIFTAGYAHERHEAYYVEGLRKEPLAPALPGVEGAYTVKEFAIDDLAVPAADPRRWKEATFERYATFAYRVEQPQPINLSNGAPALRDAEKRYELAGVAGGWRYWHYQPNIRGDTLVLQDKNNDLNALAGRRPRGLADGSQPEQNVRKLTWTIERPAPGQVVLSGPDETGGRLRVVLERPDRAYPMETALGRP